MTRYRAVGWELSAERISDVDDAFVQQVVAAYLEMGIPQSDLGLNEFQPHRPLPRRQPVRPAPKGWTARRLPGARNVGGGPHFAALLLPL